MDEAVRDLLNKMNDEHEDQLAIACMQRLAGRGFDADIRRYANRPMNRPAWLAEELRRVLASLKR